VAFGHPSQYHQLFSVRAKYRVGYFAWESSLPATSGWIYGLNFCDEVWVPNKVDARYARDWGYEGPLKIFPHGVYESYKPVRRRSDRLDMVNHGFPGVRKYSKEFFEWFADSEFANRRDCSLTFKVYSNVEEKARKLFKGVSNVNVVAKDFTIEENVRFMSKFNLHVYPSVGEGFGLMPLETMATGMPTIVPTGGWCDFDYIQPELNIPSVEGPSQDERILKYHPGNVFLVNMDDVGEKIKYASENLEHVTEMAYQRAPIAKADFDWPTLVDKQFAPYAHLLD